MTVDVSVFPPWDAETVTGVMTLTGSELALNDAVSFPMTRFSVDGTLRDELLEVRLTVSP